MNTRISVLVADDHPIVAAALANALAKWFTVVDTVTELDGIEVAVARKAPDVVVIDLEFTKASVLTRLAGLVDRYPRSRFVVLTAHAEPALADAAMRSGAVGYVVKQSAMADLRIAIEEAFAGRTYLTPAMRSRGAGGASAAWAAHGMVLSDRQRAVLALLREGLTYREIADRLDISTKTVEYHIDRMRRSIGVVSRSQLIRWSERFFPTETP